MSGGGKLRTVKGTRDLLPPETALWARVEAVARDVFGRYGYHEIRTPIVEPTELFVRGVGESTDIVGKEMYSFEDRKQRSLTLRPESTAAVARAFVEHRLGDAPLPVKLFYIGPHFRYERPQAGRYRQFHQIGAELLGDEGPLVDAELIVMLVRFLEALGYEQLEVLLNTVGDPQSRASFGDALREHLMPSLELLGEDSRRRLETNPLRILDTKISRERKLLEGAPSLEESLSEESRAHFAAVREALDGAAISYRVDPRLVRGLDYYTRTVFEIVSSDLGAQNALVGGGRYDGLIAELGGNEVPGIGFAIGEDRLIEALPATSPLRSARDVTWHVIPIGIDPSAALELAEELRQRGASVTAELGGRALKGALKAAAKRRCRYVVMLGDSELETERVTIKDYDSGEQQQLARGELLEQLTMGTWTGLAATEEG